MYADATASKYESTPAPNSAGKYFESRVSSPGNTPEISYAVNLNASTQIALFSSAPTRCVSKIRLKSNFPNRIAQHGYHAIKHINPYSRFSGTPINTAAESVISPVCTSQYTIAAANGV